MAHRFGDLEAVVMERVWAAEDDLTVRDVYESLLFERELAYTTVMSTMGLLHDPVTDSVTQPVWLVWS